MTIHQEIRKILKEKGKHIIAESIMPKVKRDVEEHTSDILSKMNKVDINNQRQYDRTRKRIYKDLISQIIRSLLKHQCGAIK